MSCINNHPPPERGHPATNKIRQQTLILILQDIKQNYG